MRLLVMGGTGYIGSHMVKALIQLGHKVVVVDNLATGYRNAVDAGATFYEFDIAGTLALKHLFNAQKFDAVLHFASFIQVDESVVEPYKYYLNNLVATLSLLDVMRDSGG